MSSSNLFVRPLRTFGHYVLTPLRTRGLRYSLLGAIACLPLAWVGVGCQHEAPPPPPAAPSIPVAHPVEREVTDFVDYTGRTDAVNTVGIRPRATGFLTKMPFREGAMVRAGELLFEIDPRPYDALVKQAQSQVDLNQASYNLAVATLKRDQAIADAVPGGVSRQQLDQDQAAVKEADARIKSSLAVLEAYQLNRSFCEVTSPIDGEVSRYFYTIGNLVNQDQTLLTTIVSVDPMYVYFDVDERTLLRARNAINKGEMKPRLDIRLLGPESTATLVGPVTALIGQPSLDSLITWVAIRTVLALPVSIGLEGEDDHPHHGLIDFINNAVNPSTGTIAVRGVFANPMPENGARLLSPGMFVRVRMPLGQPHSALLIIDRAIGNDQELKFVYVMDSQHKVQYRRVTTGPLQDDGLRVVEGLKPDDWVIVGGMQQIRPRTEIQPEETSMQSLAAELQSQVPSSGSNKPQPPPAGAHNR